ncbi:MAG: hypothetical protein D6731_17895 [Planctomycetota bacterium]|nr:MAG: hypothetical protein D6731_17895 [Planctomycetota bacterium]
MELDWLERFAWGEDRAAALDELVPGTDDSFYYRCLHAQQAGQREEVQRLLRLWIERHGHTEGARRIAARQALLDWEEHRDEALRLLRDELRPDFGHERRAEGARAPLPTRLDERLLLDSFRRHARQHEDLKRYTQRGLYALLDEELDATRRRHLLDRLERPDHPRLVDHVLADLDAPRSGGFGARKVHRLLLRDQLAELAQRRPALLQEPAFVAAMLERMRPSPAVDLEHDLQARGEYLDLLWRFVQGLAPAFNSLKAHVLYHRLELDRRLGVLDRERLLAYLRLPRPTPSANPDFLRRPEHRRHPVQLGERFPSGLPPVGDDEALVRALLADFLLQGDGIQEFEEYVREDVLRRLRVTSKLLAGLGDPDELTAELRNPALYRDLKERVELDFAPTLPTVWDRDDQVVLELDVKNVETLVVKVFALNTLNIFLATGSEPDTGIDLDGLVASEERVLRYQEPPLRRVRRRFEFPQLRGAGTWVVEFIGGGRSSRALVRKGTLRCLERVSAAGHVLRVVDERGRHVPEATVWLGGREYLPDEAGEVVLPFSNQPGTRRILLRHGSLTAVDVFEQRSEDYELHAGFAVERESLLPRAEAQLLVRASLRVAGQPIDLRLLADPRLLVRSTDRSGAVSSQETRGLELLPDRELVHSFRVPPDLASLSFELRGTVRTLDGKERELCARRTFRYNAIEGTEQVEAFHLARIPRGYALYLLGRSGEPRAGAPVALTFTHVDYEQRHRIVLQTDDAGRIELGTLEGFSEFEATAQTSQASGHWSLVQAGAELPATLHAQAGEGIALPYAGARPRADAAALSLLERRGAVWVRDLRESCASIAGGTLRIEGLPPGDFDLLLHETGQRLRLRVASGRTEGPWVVGPPRLLERTPPRRVSIERMEVEQGKLRIRLGGRTPRTRLHLVATRYLPQRLLPLDLGLPQPPGVRLVVAGPPESLLVSGRDIGDEYRYVLERRYAERWPGCMLERPSLLLNPWAVRDTDTDVAEAARGDDYERKAGKQRATGQRAGGAALEEDASEGFASVDFLAQAAIVVPNLATDAEGWIEVPLDALQGANLVRAIAVGSNGAAWRERAIDDDATPHRDLRLLRAFDPQHRLCERQQVSALSDGSLVVEDVGSSAVEHYDTLGKVFALYRALCDERDLPRFEVLTRWNSLSPEEKRERYDELAGHELHLFLSRKDPEFFAEVVRPYLQHKRHKTFLDRYLLGEDLSAYREPWAYGRLNAVERALLAHASAEERPYTERHFEDRCASLRTDPDEEERLFRTALGGSALAGEDPLGLAQAAAAAPALFGMALEAAPMGGGGAPGAAAFGSAARRPFPAPRSKKAAPPPGADPFANEKADAFDSAEEFDLLDDVDPFGEEAAAEEWPEEAASELDLQRREHQRSGFICAEPTQEFAERGYWRRRIDEQDADLVPVSRFWRDFARHREGPFLSPHFVWAHRNLTEVLCALAVLDLPFAPVAPAETRIEGARLELRVHGPTFVVHKEIAPADPSSEEAPVLVAQSYLRSDDRQRTVAGETVEKYVDGDFLTHVAYVCKIVLTNPTGSPRKLDLLLQIPQGSMPLRDGVRTRGLRLRLEPYQTRALEYAFVFPLPGEFVHYPVQVTREGRQVAAAEARTLRVLREPSGIDPDSWEWLSQRGRAEEVLAALGERNLEELDLERIAWRMHDADFFAQAIEVLRRRHVYHPVLWSYGLLHGHTTAVREVLLHEESFLDLCGPALESPLLVSDPVERGRYEHLEYFPLVNARAHRLGGRLRILNDRFAWQYRRTLELLSARPAPTHEDFLALATYLFFQDRVSEATKALARIDPEAIAERLQYDYLQAYAALHRGELEEARRFAAQHAEHPVPRWRKRFRSVLAHVREAEGGPAEDDPRARRREDRLDALAASEPSLEVSSEGGELLLRYRNLRRCRVNVYGMDVELLFSRQPFVQREATQAFFVEPNHSEEVELPADREELRLPLPPAYAEANALVEVRGGGLRRTLARYARRLSVRFLERYGQLSVHDPAGRPLPAVYVKAYARTHAGAVRFHKDGYTDVRGRFDYVTLSTGALDEIARFAVLVLSEEHGALVQEVDPPSL